MCTRNLNSLIVVYMYNIISYNNPILSEYIPYLHKKKEENQWPMVIFEDRVIPYNCVTKGRCISLHSQQPTRIHIYQANQNPELIKPYLSLILDLTKTYFLSVYLQESLSYMRGMQSFLSANHHFHSNLSPLFMCEIASPLNFSFVYSTVRVSRLEAK